MLIACQPKHHFEQVKIEGATMGTFYNVKIVHSAGDQKPDAAEIKGVIDALLVDINNSMSTYVDDSELSKLNRLARADSVSISAELLRVLDISQGVSRASEGAFDVTVRPLVELWGFGVADTDRKLTPTSEAINAALIGVGYHKLTIDMENRLLSRPEGLTVDLSAIAKGYAVDRVAEMLSDRRFSDYMVEIGGEVLTSGINSRGEAWRIGIEQPAYSLMAAPQGPALVVQLSNKAMATSGDYRNYYEVDGQRFSHTIHPKTGMPISHNLASVTVITDDCASADAWATAFNVMGVDAALKLANQLNIAAFFIVKTQEGFETLSSEAFVAYKT